MHTSILQLAVSCSTDYEALLLISLCALKRTRKDDSFSVREVLTKIESVANTSGEARYMDAHLSFDDVLGMVNRLGNVREFIIMFASLSQTCCLVILMLSLALLS